jgi:hypothetical protein
MGVRVYNARHSNSDCPITTTEIVWPVFLKHFFTMHKGDVLSLCYDSILNRNARTFNNAKHNNSRRKTPSSRQKNGIVSAIPADGNKIPFRVGALIVTENSVISLLHIVRHHTFYFFGHQADVRFRMTTCTPLAPLFAKFLAPYTVFVEGRNHLTLAVDVSARNAHNHLPGEITFASLLIYGAL